MSLSASATSESPVILLRFFDVVLITVAAPIMLLIGVSAPGYLIAAGAWILLRAVGVGVDRAAVASRAANQQITLRLGYLMSRLFLLALVVILVRRGDGRGAGLAALLVIVVAFTIELLLSVANRPRSR